MKKWKNLKNFVQNKFCPKNEAIMKKILCLIIFLITLVSCTISYQDKMCEGCPVSYQVVDDIQNDDIRLEEIENKKFVKIFLNDINSMYEISTFTFKLDNTHLNVILCKYEVNKSKNTYDLLITIELKDKKYEKVETVSFLWKEEIN